MFICMWREKIEKKIIKGYCTKTNDLLNNMHAYKDVHSDKAEK